MCVNDGLEEGREIDVGAIIESRSYYNDLEVVMEVEKKKVKKLSGKISRAQ